MHRDDHARQPVDQCGVQPGVGEREPERLAGDRRRAAHYGGRGRSHGAVIGPQHHVGVEQRDERVEVAATRGAEEGVDDDALTREIGIRGPEVRALHASSGATRELSRRDRRSADHRPDLVERQLEHVVEHERETLRGREGVEHDEHREPDRVGKHGFLLGLEPAFGRDDGVRDVDLERFLAPDAARSQHVQAHPRDDRGEPPAEVLDLARVRAADAQPRVLHRVVGLGE